MTYGDRSGIVETLRMPKALVALKLPHRRNNERTEANAEHRRREDAAPRLRDEIPSLLTLRFRFEERREAGKLQATAYAKPVVVASAPASFEIPCMEPQCDGRHDLTYAVLKALRSRSPSLTGESACTGYIQDRPCDRMLVYTFDATYSG